MEGEYQRAACAIAGGKGDTGRRRGRKQKCKEGGRNNNLKAMDLECIREESVGSVGDKEQCLNTLPQNSPCLSFPSLQLRISGKPGSAQAGRAAHSQNLILAKKSASLPASADTCRAVGWGVSSRVCIQQVFWG